MDDLERYKTFKNMFSKVGDILKSRYSLRIGEYQTLAELGLFIDTFMSSACLNKPDEENLKSWLDVIWSKLDEKFYSTALVFYYLNRDWHKDPDGYFSKAIPQIVVDKAIVKLGSQSVSLSLFKTMIKEIPKLIITLNDIMKDESTEKGVLFWFMVLNLLDFVSEIRNEDGGSINSEFLNFKSFIEKNSSSLKTAADTNKGLMSFAFQMKNIHNLKVGIKEPPLNDLGDKALAFALIYKLKIGDKITKDIFEKMNKYKESHLFWVIYAWGKLLSMEGSLGSIPYFIEENMSSIYHLVWENSGNSSCDLTELDISNIRSIGDKEIRRHLYSFFIKHPMVMEGERARLIEELRKSNAPGEISDFNVEIELDKNKRKMICIPIKSGKELRDKKTKKITEDYTYQMIRPLATFPGRSVVFPVIIAEETVAATELFSMFRVNLNLPISPIVTDTYAKIMKNAGILG